MVEDNMQGAADSHLLPKMVYTTDDGREASLVNMAYDYAEAQLAGGHPPAYVVQHFLRVGSHSQKVIDRKHEAEAEYERRKIEAMDEEAKAAVKYDELIAALRSYGGGPASGDMYAT